MGLVGALVILAVGIAVTVAVAQRLQEDEPAPTAAATPCTPLDPPYGAPPRDFSYEPVEEPRRAQTVKALRLDEAEEGVAVGVKGCRTVLISALDPEATKFLAAAIFSGAR